MTILAQVKHMIQHSASHGNVACTYVKIAIVTYRTELGTIRWPIGRAV